jgi:hypothetical protein
MALMGVALVPGHAASVHVFPLVDGTGALPDRAVVGIGGEAMTFGFVGTGVFSSADLQVDQWVIGGNLGELVNAFSPVFGTDNFQDGIPTHYSISAIPGFFSIIDVAVDPLGEGLVGASIYTFIGNGSSLADSTAIALFRHNGTLDSNPGTTLQLNLGEGEVKIGGFTTVSIPLDEIGTGTPTFSALQLIPEPSALVLGITGLTGIFRRRR